MVCRKKARGSVTVEAAVVLPIFICVVFSIAFMIKLVYTHEIIQHAITGSADELAMYSYLYGLSRTDEINDSMTDNINNGKALIEEQADAFFEAFGSFQSTSKMDRAAETIGEILEDPRKEVIGIACLTADSLYNEGKTAAIIPLIKLNIRKYLKSSTVDDADERVKKLNIVGGMDGLNFSSSRIFDGNNDIDIVVKYRVELDLPFDFLPELNMIQRASARAWLGENDYNQDSPGDGRDPNSPGTDEEKGKEDDKEEEFDIWSLPWYERGKLIEKKLGRNLPQWFPAICKYDGSSKTGISIDSINLRNKSYQNYGNIKKAIQKYIDRLDGFDGAFLDGDYLEVKHKRLIIIIPKDSTNEEIQKLFEECRKEAESKGIELEFKEL